MLDQKRIQEKIFKLQIIRNLKLTQNQIQAPNQLINLRLP